MTAFIKPNLILTVVTVKIFKTMYLLEKMCDIHTPIFICIYTIRQFIKEI